MQKNNLLFHNPGQPMKYCLHLQSNLLLCLHKAETYGPRETIIQTPNYYGQFTCSQNNESYETSHKLYLCDIYTQVQLVPVVSIY